MRECPVLTANFLMSSLTIWYFLCLSEACRRTAICFRVSGVFRSPSFIRSTSLQSSLRYLVDISLSHSGKVAEKSIFWGFFLACSVIDSQIRSISFLNPNLSISSAQSRHRALICFILITPRSIRSTSLPGVPTIMSTPSLMSSICRCIGACPQTATALKSGFLEFTRLVIYCQTCKVSSLVGRMIKNLGNLVLPNSFLSRILSMTGRVKAKVFPEPVLSLAMMSSPLQME